MFLICIAFAKYIAVLFIFGNFHAYRILKLDIILAVCFFSWHTYFIWFYSPGTVFYFILPYLMPQFLPTYWLLTFYFSCLPSFPDFSRKVTGSFILPRPGWVSSILITSVDNMEVLRFSVFSTIVFHICWWMIHSYLCPNSFIYQICIEAIIMIIIA